MIEANGAYDAAHEGGSHASWASGLRQPKKTNGRIHSMHAAVSIQASGLVEADQKRISIDQTNAKIVTSLASEESLWVYSFYMVASAAIVVSTCTKGQTNPCCLI